MSDSHIASSQSLNGSNRRRRLRIEPSALVFLAVVVIFAFPGGSVAGNGKGLREVRTRLDGAADDQRVAARRSDVDGERRQLEGPGQ